MEQKLSSTTNTQTALINNDSLTDCRSQQPFYSQQLRTELIIFAAVESMDKLDKIATEINLVRGQNVYSLHGSGKTEALYHNYSDVMSIHYLPSETAGKTKMDIYVPHPTDKFLNTLCSMFETNGVQYDLMRIELAWDFYVEDAHTFKDYLVSHIFPSGSIVSCDEDYEVFNNFTIRDSASGIYIYPTTTAQNEITRLLIVLNKPLLKKLGIQSPPKLDSINLLHAFEIMGVDTIKLSQYLKG